MLCWLCFISSFAYLTISSCVVSSSYHINTVNNCEQSILLDRTSQHKLLKNWFFEIYAFLHLANLLNRVNVAFNCSLDMHSIIKWIIFILLLMLLYFLQICSFQWKGQLVCIYDKEMKREMLHKANNSNTNNINSSRLPIALHYAFNSFYFILFLFNIFFFSFSAKRRWIYDLLYNKHVACINHF